MIPKIQQQAEGFTLIEGIIAVGIIGSALIVGLTLAHSNLQAAQSNADRVLASHLAREGIEVIRNMRDSNWIRRDKNIDKQAGGSIDFYDWNDLFDAWPTMASATCLTDNTVCYDTYFDIILNTAFPTNANAYTLRRDTTHTDTIACINNGAQPSCRIQKNAEGVYFQSTVGTAYTQFYRRIILRPICLDDKGTASIDDDTMYVNTQSSIPLPTTPCGLPTVKDPVGVLVTSHVVWQRGSKTLEVKFKERLYNWRNL